jgi:hypothetical protein
MAVKLLVQGPSATEAVAQLTTRHGLSVLATPVSPGREKTTDPLTVLAVITTSVDAMLQTADKLLQWRESQKAQKTIELAAVDEQGSLRDLDQLTRDELIALIRKLSEESGDGEQ